MTYTLKANSLNFKTNVSQPQNNCPKPNVSQPKDRCSAPQGQMPKP